MSAIDDTAPPSSPPPAVQRIVSPDALAAAIERRTQNTTPTLTAAQQAAQHEERQKFRRLIDPGIMRPNPKDQALESLKTLETISDNILREPDNPKYQQFKPTNSLIKRTLVDRKGTLEYAIELGFRPDVQNFQPYYKFNKRHMETLRIGNAILKEFLEVENVKAERIKRSKENEKAAREAAAERVKLAFMDDRRTKELRDQMEKESRAGRALIANRLAAESNDRGRSESPSVDPMPGSGRVLGDPAATEPGEDVGMDQNMNLDTTEGEGQDGVDRVHSPAHRSTEKED